ncbi:MAG: hypothetical protein ABJF01_08605 [bacterium]
MSDRIENIGARGAQWRRRGGIAWLGITVVAFAALWAAGVPHWYRLSLAVPIGLSGVGFLQAREKTCVALCAVGKREPTRDRPETTLTAAERVVLRRRSAWIVLRVVVIVVVSTTLLVCV